MRKVGLLGGTSWHSSMDYYRLLNESINLRLGGVASADIILRSVDFATFHQYQVDGAWNKISNAFIKDARAMEKMGAEGIVICANTMHLVADDIQNAISIPVLHIADAIAESANQYSVETLGVLGTIFTMEKSFYVEALQSRQLKTLVPNSDDRQCINSVIFDELCKGDINSVSKDKYLTIIQSLQKAGADAIVLGCTEIGMLIKSSDVELPVIDSLQSHVSWIVNWMLHSE